MRHQIFGKKLSRTKNARRVLLQNLCRQFIQHEQIITTHAKAKAVQPLIEKLITHAKKNTGSSVLQIRKVIADGKTVKKLLQDALTVFSKRTSGYTRLMKVDIKRQDASRMAVLSYVDKPVQSEEITVKKVKPRKKV